MKKLALLWIVGLAALSGLAQPAEAGQTTSIYAPPGTQSITCGGDIRTGHLASRPGFEHSDAMQRTHPATFQSSFPILVACTTQGLVSHCTASPGSVVSGLCAYRWSFEPEGALEQFLPNGNTVQISLGASCSPGYLYMVSVIVTCGRDIGIAWSDIPCLNQGGIGGGFPPAL